MFSPSRALYWCDREREREASDKHNRTRQVTHMHYGKDNLEQMCYYALQCPIREIIKALLVILGYDVEVKLLCSQNKDVPVLKW